MALTPAQKRERRTEQAVVRAEHAAAEEARLLAELEAAIREGTRKEPTAGWRRATYLTLPGGKRLKLADRDGMPTVYGRLYQRVAEEPANRYREWPAADWGGRDSKPCPLWANMF